MIWVIGDIHGMFDPLKTLIGEIEKKEYLLRRSFEISKKTIPDLAEPESYSAPTPIKLIFIGDYIDFGPSSKEVIDYIINIKHEKITLLGNHEDMLLRAKENGGFLDEINYMWFKNGGRRTLDSFDKDCAMFAKYHEDLIKGGSYFKSSDIVLDDIYWDFLYDLKVTHHEEIKLKDRIQKFFFSHGGLYLPSQHELLAISRGLKSIQKEYRNKCIERQLKLSSYGEYKRYLSEEGISFDNSLLWQRREMTEKYGDFILVHGHTPTFLIPDYYINIGNYAFPPGKYDNIPYFMFEDRDVNIIENELYINNPRYIYKSFIEKLIEINIDTGCVFRRRLSALGLSADSLEQGRFEVIQIDPGKNYRTNNDIISWYSIKVNPNE